MTDLHRPLRLGTRGSDLALVQTRSVSAALRAAHPGLDVAEVVISTRGDREADRPFAAIGSRGIFARDIESALLDGTIDLAVHSLKDLESVLPAGLAIGAMLPRADARDALVAASTDLARMRPGARVATSSVRRSALLRHLRPDLEIVPIRGNVPTRLRKARDQGLDGLVLACAGLDRLGLDGAIRERLDPERFVPEAGQGIVAVEAREGSPAEAFLAAIHDAPTGACATAERACVTVLEGSCRTPIAAHAIWRDGALRLTALVCSPDGRQLLQRSASGPPEAPAALGQTVAAHLLAAGAGALLRSLPVE